MLFVAGKDVYCETEDGVFICSVIGKDVVRTYSELDSVEVKPEIKADAIPEDAMPATIDEVVAKFQVREASPHLASAPEVEPETPTKKTSGRKRA